MPTINSYLRRGSHIRMKMWIGALALFSFLVALIAGCSNSNPSAEQDSAVTGSSVEGGSSDPLLVRHCVQVFYDGDKDPTGAATVASGDGRLYADMIANLLGHFKELTPVESPIALYKKGDVEKCPSSLYVGSDFYATLPSDFLADFAATKKRVAWLGYGFWNLGASLPTTFGAEYIDLVEQDAPLAVGAAPGFYRDVLYKGETFSKYGKYAGTVFNCDCEVAQLKITDSSRATVLASIKHSISGTVLPYALRAGNHFLFADLPLTDTYEADRYNVFADILFDIVNLPARHAQHLAAIRLEDIHAMVDLPTLDEAMGLFKAENVTPNLSMIPLFADPLGRFGVRATSAPIPSSTQVTFMQHVDQYKTQGAVFLWHGVTHQYENLPNPYDGVSGDDYEFWDYNKNQPWAQDSESFVTERMSWGHDVFTQMGLNPSIWVTPHYVASNTDNGVFARLIPWSMGRITYFSPRASDGFVDETQFFPYEIYRDTYGTRIIPENLNYVSTDPAAPNSVDDMLANAKRNLVLRDSWASAFYHPYLLGGQNPAATDLQKLIKGLKALGYTFVNLESCVATAGCLKN